MKAILKKIQNLLSLLIIIAWTTVWLYPGAWHLMHVNSRIHDWCRLVGYSEQKSLPLTDLWHRFNYPDHNAIIKGRPERITWSNLAPPQIDSKDSYGYNMLAYAAALNDTEMLGSLLIKGADPNLPSANHSTPLLFCAKNKNAKAADILLQFSAKADTADSKGETPLHYAAIHELSVIILKAKADETNFDCLDKKMFSPLDWAVSKNKLKSIIELTLAGAEPVTRHYKVPPMISAYLALCRKLEDPAKAASILAESDPDSDFQKLNSRYNLPAELPVDTRKTPIKRQGETQ